MGRLNLRTCIGALLALAPLFASAQAFPAKPVKMVIPYPAGGLTDVIGRAAATEITKERYREELPLIEGAVDAVRRLASEFPLAVASSSNRPLIEAVLEGAEIAELFAAVVSSEEVARGKPAPDVYLEAARRLGVEPGRCAAVEDSSNGIRAAHAAGMRVLALPNVHYPPAPDALALADAVISSPVELTPELVRAA